MIVVTGGAGFIGSALVWELNRRGHEDILVVDRLYESDKWKNLRRIDFLDYLDKQDFLEAVKDDRLEYSPDVVFHLGASSSTTETDLDYLMKNNYGYTRELAKWCLENGSRFIYASSAATYGDGSNGYSDDHENISRLSPLNPYGFSKQRFDEYAHRKGWLSDIVGLKYFNVYGPNEYHKGNMRSVVNKSYPQARDEGTIRLFKSHVSEYEHGQQKRDFLYVKDAVKMTLFFMENPEVNGIYNIGTGTARTFDDLAKSIFDALDKPVDIEYFDMPEDIRPNYQYYTQADLTKLRNAGFTDELHTLEEGIKDYVINYLDSDNGYLSS
ncbi:MAG: ADP-glyceromanno-heptose 6-epimerase [bacterium]